MHVSTYHLLAVNLSTQDSACQHLPTTAYHCGTRVSTPIVMDCQPINADQRVSALINYWLSTYQRRSTHVSTYQLPPITA